MFSRFKSNGCLCKWQSYQRSVGLLSVKALHSQSARQTPQTLTEVVPGSHIQKKVKVINEETKCAAPLSVPDFSDHKEAYRSKSFLKLLRAFVVFQLCSVDRLVDRQLQLLKWCRTLLGKTLFVAGMKRMLYGQFMGGETREEVFASIKHNVKYGVQPMIAFTASETHGDSDKDDADPDTMKKFFADCLLAVAESLEYAHGMRGLSSTVPMASSKLTFIKPHQLFTTTSTLIVRNNDYIRACQQQQTDPEATQFTAMVQDCIRSNNRNGSMESAMTNMAFHLQLFSKGNRDFPKYKECMQNVGVDVDEIKRTEDILFNLGKKAEELGVIFIWDAEQSYLQTAMDVFTLDSMRSHNKHRAVVHQTYQCYLKKAFDKLLRDTDLAASEGFCWGGKIVRGAYMVEERRLATEQGYEDPVNPSYEATTAMYQKVINQVLTLMAERPVGAVNVTSATHNVDTVAYVLNRISESGFNPGEHFRFAQLLGMRDNLTFSLGQSGVPVAKLVHYGPVEDCIAYLSRRVTENRSGIATANSERHLLGNELLARIKRN